MNVQVHLPRSVKLAVQQFDLPATDYSASPYASQEPLEYLAEYVAEAVHLNAFANQNRFSFALW